MYKGTIASGTALAASTNIPFTTVIDNSYSMQYNSTDNNISIMKAGYYDVTVNLPLTDASATPLTIQLYANDVAISDAICSKGITASTGIDTFTITDTIRVANAIYPNIAKLSVRLIGGTAEMYDIGYIIITERGVYS